MNGVRRKRVASAVANLPLFAKGMVVVAIPVAALILILAALAVFLKEKDEAERAVQQTMRVRSAIFNIRSLVADAEASLRGYVLVGEERWLAIYQGARRELPGALNRLLILVEDNPSQRRRAAAAQRLMEEKLAGLERLASLRRRGVAALDAELTQSRIVMQRLRDVGFSDQEIVDIAIAASARVYFASALQALAVEVDRPPMLTAPLREALLEGIDRT